MRLLFVLLLMATPLVCHAQAGPDLDAPAVKRVTIKSELERGKSAMFACNLNTKPTSVFELGQCPFGILEQNKQKNTDTDAFVLGMAFEAWSDLTILLGVIESRPDREQRGYAQGVTNAELWFKTWKEKAALIPLDDQKLCEVLQVNYQALKPTLDAWNARGKSSASESPKKFQAGIRFRAEERSLHVLLVDREGPNLAMLNQYLVAIEGKRGSGLELQAALTAAVLRHQDGSPISVTLVRTLAGPEEEAKLGLFAKP